MQKNETLYRIFVLVFRSLFRCRMVAMHSSSTTVTPWRVVNIKTRNKNERVYLLYAIPVRVIFHRMEWLILLQRGDRRNKIRVVSIASKD